MVESTVLKSNMALRYVAGQDDNGKDVLKIQTFSNLRSAALDEDIFAVGTALSTVLVSGSAEVHKKDDCLITNA